MKRLLMIILGICCIKFCCAQQTTPNLILNNSFEYINSVSTEYQQASFLTRDSSFTTTAAPCWVRPAFQGFGFDYDTAPVAAYNLYAFVSPQNGIRALKLVTGNTYADTFVSCGAIQTKLRSPLTAGQTYFISGYLNAYIDSFMSNFDYRDSGTSDLISHIKQMGFLFSDSKIYESSLQGFNGVAPSIVYNIQPFPYRLGSNAWQKFEMIYTATGGENYLTLGNFDSSSNNLMIYPDHDSIVKHLGYVSFDSIVFETYLFIDNLTLIPLSDTAYTVINPFIQNPDSLNLGNDLLLCTGHPPIALYAGGGFETYLWSTGDTLPIIQVSHPGVYMVTVDNGCMNRSDTIVILPDTAFVAPQLPNTGLCDNTTANYTIDSGQYNSILWSNGDTAYSVNLPHGTYWLTVANSCHVRNDTFTVEYYGADTVHLFPDTTYIFCSDATNYLTAPTGYTNYLWSNNSTGNQLQIAQPGIYWVSVTNVHNCAITDTVVALFIDSPYITHGWPQDTTICQGAALDVALIPNTTRATYNWNITDANQHSLQRTISNSGDYTFTISNVCGIASYDFTLSTKNCTDTIPPPPSDTSVISSHVYIPNSFSPNGDGVNDVFKLYSNISLLFYECSIFNRWGELVYQSNNPDEGWDGSYKGAIQSPGVFVYIIKYTPVNEAVEQMANGSITLIR